MQGEGRVRRGLVREIEEKESKRVRRGLLRENKERESERRVRRVRKRKVREK